ncbi:MAG: methyltransferase [Parerythrobacter sp.]
MKRADLATFAATFADDDDPWQTFTARDEAIKRSAIVHAVGPHRLGRVYELASGNGSNSKALITRAMRLDAVEGTAEGTKLTQHALRAEPRARALHLPLPARSPRAGYDCIVIAELLYYLTQRQMHRVAIETDRIARPGTRLVLAHHTIDFHDFSQHAHGIHGRFLSSLTRFGALRTVRRTSKWIVQVASACR